MNKPLFQFHGAFKRYFKTKSQRELERRWNRIHRIRCDLNLVCIKNEPSSLILRKSIGKQSYHSKKLKSKNQGSNKLASTSYSPEINEVFRGCEENLQTNSFEWGKYANEIGI